MVVGDFLWERFNGGGGWLRWEGWEAFTKGGKERPTYEATKWNLVAGALN